MIITSKSSLLPLIDPSFLSLRSLGLLPLWSGGCILPSNPHLWSEDSTLAWNLKNTGAMIIRASVYNSGFTSEELTERTSGFCLPSTEHSGFTVGVSLREEPVFVPTSSFTALAQRFCLETKKAIKQPLITSQGNWLLSILKVEKFKPKGTLKNSGDFVKATGRWFKKQAEV